ncbi:hypothetical protein RVR_P174 (plasmid) [Actinacidiphila reveromycinica]|uniref:Uncharacterized protein n=1 Tax=Actinacidiphila reveromycinica TaxID=659352 RepID=A0A7R6QIF1_9ACTN|nr:hypothetical protein [Streptomyces sp. SN-593]BBG20693.1 hypothetical protein RVR_P174 [Streptomyces sp. SN-593]
MPTATPPAVKFSLAYALLRAAADVADHWVIAASTVSTVSRVARVEVAR